MYGKFRINNLIHVLKQRTEQKAFSKSFTSELATNTGPILHHTRSVTMSVLYITKCLLNE